MGEAECESPNAGPSLDNCEYLVPLIRSRIRRTTFSPIEREGAAFVSESAWSCQRKVLQNAPGRGPKMSLQMSECSETIEYERSSIRSIFDPTLKTNDSALSYTYHR